MEEGRKTRERKEWRKKEKEDKFEVKLKDIVRKKNVKRILIE